jgi:hypothetical protein
VLDVGQMRSSSGISMKMMMRTEKLRSGGGRGQPLLAFFS